MGVFEYRIMNIRAFDLRIKLRLFDCPVYPPAGVEGGMFLVVRSIKTLVQPLCGCWFLLGWISISIRPRWGQEKSRRREGEFGVRSVRERDCHPERSPAKQEEVKDLFIVLKRYKRWDIRNESSGFEVWESLNIESWTFEHSNDELNFDCSIFSVRYSIFREFWFQLYFLFIQDKNGFVLADKLLTFMFNLSIIQWSYRILILTRGDIHEKTDNPIYGNI